MIKKFYKIHLWKKIFLMSYLLITIVTLVLSYHVISLSGENNIKREITNSLDKHNVISNALIMYAGSISEQFENDTNLAYEVLSTAVRNYGRYYTENNSFLAVTSKNGEKLYSSINEEDEKAMKLSPSEDGRRSHVIRSIGERTVLFVSGWININESLYRLDYEHDITDLIRSQKSLALEVSLWLLCSNVILGFGLFLITKYSLNPVRELSLQARAITKGMYEQRIKVRSSDEIGQLAEDFNQMADAVQEKVRLLKQEAKDRETFIASLAHELKTPLTSIMGYSSLIQNCSLDEDYVKQAISFIYKESKRLDNISEKLLELFRLSNEHAINKKKVYVAAMLEQLVHATTHTLSEKNQSLEIESSVEYSFIDQDLFIALLSNLVENASKASKKGDIIKLKVYSCDSSVIFSVEDHGSGIPEEHIDDIFKPFFMLDSSRDKRQKNNGLGLSLCKAITEAHNGHIEIKSKVGKGTSVIVSIPDEEYLQNHDKKIIEQ